MKYETCVVCDCDTGKAGNGDDSIYYHKTNGEPIGPLCEDCYEVVKKEEEMETRGGETKIKHKNGELEMELKLTEKELNIWAIHPYLQNVCNAFISFLKEFPDAKNYLSMKGHSEDGEQFEVLIQRVNGITPAQKAAKLEHELSELKADVMTLKCRWATGYTDRDNCQICRLKQKWEGK